ncbi:MAG: hypothetical protein RL404_2833 [Pseudomonadota bacterium]|jgi:hypothetical protein
MAEIKNYTLKFGYGRARCALNFAAAKLASTEIERSVALREQGHQTEVRRG